MTMTTVYRSVESTLNILQNHKDEVQAVNALLQVYNNTLEESKRKDRRRLHPWIVLEGLDGSGKSTCVRNLASKFKAWKWCTPPRSIQPIRKLFDDHPTLRPAYYALGNYIAALEVGSILHKKPIIMDRYWHSTAAFAIAGAVNDFPDGKRLPPKGDSFYTWPDDLLKPDAVIFLQVSEAERIRRLSRRQEITAEERLLQNSQRFREDITLAYKNMVDPEVIFINADGDVEDMLQQVVTHIQHLFLK